MHAVPFRPFRVHLPGSKKIRVPHSDFISISPSGQIVVIHGPKDEVYTVDVFLIAALELESAKAGRASKT